jgi:hypothetical protein
MLNEFQVELALMISKNINIHYLINGRLDCKSGIVASKRLQLK